MKIKQLIESDIECLNGLSQNERKKILRDASPISLKANELLIKEGDNPSHLYLLLEGKLVILKEGEGDSTHILAYISEGNLVGEMGLIDKKPRSASVQAIKDSALLKFNISQLANHGTCYTKIICNIAKSLANKVRNVNLITIGNIEKNIILEKKSMIDELTKAYNRHFLKSLIKEFNVKYFNLDFSLLMIDIDNFKQINDKYGHPEGDNVLKLFSKTAQSILRKTDILCRYGGDEFIVALPGCDLEEAIYTAERLRKAIEKLKIPCCDSFLEFTISVGVAKSGSKEKQLSPIMKRADEALYIAKQKGRNTVAY